jgi:hypothetical protein
MPEVQLVTLHYPDAQIAVQPSAAVEHLSIFTDYTQILDESHPDSAFHL